MIPVVYLAVVFSVLSSQCCAAQMSIIFSSLVPLRIGEVRPLAIAVNAALIPRLPADKYPVKLLISSTSQDLIRLVPSVYVDARCNATISSSVVSCEVADESGEQNFNFWVSLPLSVPPYSGQTSALYVAVKILKSDYTSITGAQLETNIMIHLGEATYSPPSLVSLSEPLNQIRPGSQISVRSSGFPSKHSKYTLFGPFVAQINFTDSTSAKIDVPNVSFEFSEVRSLCYTRAVLDALVAKHTDPEVRATLLTALTREALTKLVSLWCTAANGWTQLPLHAAHFALFFSARVEVAPHLLMHVPVLRAGTLLEAGSTGTLKIVLVDTYPFTTHALSVIVPTLTTQHSPPTCSAFIDKFELVSSEVFANESVAQVFDAAIVTHNSCYNCSFTLSLEVSDQEWHVQWKWSYKFPLTRPSISVQMVTDSIPGRRVRIDVSLATGFVLVAPTISIERTASIVAVHIFSNETGCVQNDDSTVECSIAELHSPSTFSRVTYIDMPSYYVQTVTLGATVTALNADSVEAKHVFTPPALHNETVRSVQSVQNLRWDQCGILCSMGMDNSDGAAHFLSVTIFVQLLWTGVLLIVKVVMLCWKRDAHRDGPSNTQSVTLAKTMMAHHLWVGLVYPCHQHCAIIHLTIFFSSLYCSMLLTSFAISELSVATDWGSNALFGVAAAVALLSLAPRPVFSWLFFCYKTHPYGSQRRYRKHPYRWHQAVVDCAVPKLRCEGVGMMSLHDLGESQFDRSCHVVQAPQPKDDTGRVYVDVDRAPRNTDANDDDEDSSLKRRSSVSFARRVHRSLSDSQGAVPEMNPNPATENEASLHLSPTVMQMVSNGGPYAAYPASESDEEKEEEEVEQAEGDNGESVPKNLVRLDVGLHHLLGYAVCIGCSLVMCILLYRLSDGWEQQHTGFLFWSMIFVGAADLVVGEWVYMALLFGYKYINSNETDEVHKEIHPYHGEIRRE